MQLATRQGLTKVVKQLLHIKATLHHILLLQGYKPVQHVTALNMVTNYDNIYQSIGPYTLRRVA